MTALSKQSPTEPIDESGIDGTTGERPGAELRALVTMNDGLALWPTLVNGPARW
jgi:hypothetical protein